MTLAAPQDQLLQQFNYCKLDPSCTLAIFKGLQYQWRHHVSKVMVLREHLSFLKTLAESITMYLLKVELNTLILPEGVKETPKCKPMGFGNDYYKRNNFTTGALVQWVELSCLSQLTRVRVPSLAFASDRYPPPQKPMGTLERFCEIRDWGSSLGSSHSRWCSSGSGELPELFLVGWTIAGAKRHP
ncbi:hypothetical protein Tco_0629547 [Tanacetum coccineum]|uniref:Uncharacterized protein n=1 Tax=Tanacetum coccineum TaxID=301880 RepID=A0ABQ4WTG4_9ASTR